MVEISLESSLVSIISKCAVGSVRERLVKDGVRGPRLQALTHSVPPHFGAIRSDLCSPVSLVRQIFLLKEISKTPAGVVTQTGSGASGKSARMSAWPRFATV